MTFLNRLCAGLGLALALTTPALAHKASDAYLQLQSRPDGLTLRLDVALRDLDAALDIDTDGDGRLTWGEVKAAWPAVLAYAQTRVAVQGCPLVLQDKGLEQRSDGAYAVLWMASPCELAGEPSIAYHLFQEVDATHRGIAKIEHAGNPTVVRVLDPAQSATVVDAPGAARPAATPPASFLAEGVHHILNGYDHVLFLLCLLLPAVLKRVPGRDGAKPSWTPVPTLWQAVLPVAGIVTMFTLAHSITLALASLGWIALPSRVIEPAIAVTIVLAAVDNLWPIFRGRRGAVTFLFGLVHGFGFAGVLAELQLPASQFFWALLQFNLGLELGQLMIVLAALGTLYFLRTSPRYPAWVVRGGSVAAGLVAMTWFIERTANVALPW